MALLWLIAGVVLIAAEILSGDFFLLMIGTAALAGAGAEFIFGNTFVSSAVFALVALGLITVARPWLKSRMHGAHIPDNIAALVGGQATVTATVDSTGGRIKLKGEVWSARTFDESQVLEPGTTVTVVEISGATAVVWAERP
jgi:membrane protein implicated in regulation of membrane protease activity